jgi:hypothetical protein
MLPNARMAPTRLGHALAARRRLPRRDVGAVAGLDPHRAAWTGLCRAAIAPSSSAVPGRLGLDLAQALLQAFDAPFEIAQLVRLA